MISKRKSQLSYLLQIILAWDDPYLLGIVHDKLEVYTLEGCLHIQTIKDLNKARLICRCKQGKVFVASISSVWCVTAVDVTQQIRTLLEQNQFQLALKLTVRINIIFVLFSMIFFLFFFLIELKN